MDIDTLWNAGAAIAACVTALWLVSIRLKDVSIVDIWWGPGFALIAWVVHAATPEPSLRLSLAAAILTLWGARLGLFLGQRNLGHGEDKRYVAIRGGSPHFWWTSLFKVFWLQGLLQIVVSSPVFAIQGTQTPMGPADWLGALIAFSGVAIEATADQQLKAFKADPANAKGVMRTGVWAWTRHPNYFGNALIWLGIGLMAVTGGAPWWAFAGPSVMWFLLLRVSGVSMLERTITDRRPEYRAYIEEVPAFIPRWPKRSANQQEG
jgi:steroid 5-alpha reductase family enzyme